jgi:hypothetical protein
LPEQVSLSPDLCHQPTNQIEAKIYRRYFIQKRAHKIVANVVWSFYKNIFEVEILHRLISVLFLYDRSKLSFAFLEANLYLLVQFSCHRNSHIDGVRMRQPLEV